MPPFQYTFSGVLVAQTGTEAVYKIQTNKIIFKIETGPSQVWTSFTHHYLCLPSYKKSTALKGNESDLYVVFLLAGFCYLGLLYCHPVFIYICGSLVQL